MQRRRAHVVNEVDARPSFEDTCCRERCLLDRCAAKRRGHEDTVQHSKVLCDQRGALLVHERAGQPARLVAHLEDIAQVMELVGRPLVQRSVGLYRLYRLYRLSSARYGARLYSAPSDGFTTIPVRRLHNHPCPTASQPSLSDGFTTMSDGARSPRRARTHGSWHTRRG